MVRAWSYSWMSYKVALKRISCEYHNIILSQLLEPGADAANLVVTTVRCWAIHSHLLLGTMCTHLWPCSCCIKLCVVNWILLILWVSWCWFCKWAFLSPLTLLHALMQLLLEWLQSPMQRMRLLNWGTMRWHLLKKPGIPWWSLQPVDVGKVSPSHGWGCCPLHAGKKHSITEQKVFGTTDQGISSYDSKQAQFNARSVLRSLWGLQVNRLFYLAQADEAAVLRDGKLVTLAAAQLVPGDVVEVAG